MLTPATITVNFTANYAGAHRICWRQCNVGSYVCTNIVSCVGGGNVCSATISIMVDPESCTPICFEGYIQATCNPENSSVGQVPWSTTFTPTPTCSMYSIACTSLELNQPCSVIPAATMGLGCTDCEQYTITIIPGIMPSELNGSSIYYIDCATKELIRIDLTGSVSYTLTACMVTGSINVYLTPTVSSIITQGIPCP